MIETCDRQQEEGHVTHAINVISSITYQINSTMNELEEEKENGRKGNLSIDEFVTQTKTSLIEERNEVEKKDRGYLSSLLEWDEDNGSVTSDPIAGSRSICSNTDSATSDSSSWGPFQNADDANHVSGRQSPPQQMSHEQLLLEDDEDSSDGDEDIFLISSGSGTDTESETASKRESIGKPPLHPSKPSIRSPSKTSKFEVVDKSSYADNDSEEEGEGTEESDSDSSEGNDGSDPISDDRSEDSNTTDRYLGVYEVDESISSQKTPLKVLTSSANEDTTQAKDSRFYKSVRELDTANSTDEYEDRFAESEGLGEEREGGDEVRDEAEREPAQEDVCAMDQLKYKSKALEKAVRKNDDRADADETSCLEFAYSDEDFEDTTSGQESTGESLTNNNLPKYDAIHDVNKICSIANKAVKYTQLGRLGIHEVDSHNKDSQCSALPLTPSTAQLINDQNINNRASLIELTYSDEDFEDAGDPSTAKMINNGIENDVDMTDPVVHKPDVQEASISPAGGDLDIMDSQYPVPPLTPDSDVRPMSKQAIHRKPLCLNFTFSDEDSEDSRREEDRIYSLKPDVHHNHSGTDSTDHFRDETVPGVRGGQARISIVTSESTDRIASEEAPTHQLSPTPASDEIEKEHLERFLIRMKETAKKALHESSFKKEDKEIMINFGLHDIQQWIRDQEKPKIKQTELQQAHGEHASPELGYEKRHTLANDLEGDPDHISSSADLVQENKCHDTSSDDEFAYCQSEFPSDMQNNGAFPDFGLNDVRYVDKSCGEEILNIKEENEKVVPTLSVDENNCGASSNLEDRGGSNLEMVPDLGLDDIHHGTSSDSEDLGDNILEKVPDLGLDDIHHGASSDSEDVGGSNLEMDPDLGLDGIHYGTSSDSEDSVSHLEIDPDLGLDDIHHGTSSDSEDSDSHLEIQGEHLYRTPAYEALREKVVSCKSSDHFSFCDQKTRLVDTNNSSNAEIKKVDSYNLLTAYLKSVKNNPAEVCAISAALADFAERPKPIDPPGIRLGSSREPSPTSTSIESRESGREENSRVDDATEVSFPILTPKSKKFGSQFPSSSRIDSVESSECKTDHESRASTGGTQEVQTEIMQIDFGAYFDSTEPKPNQNRIHISQLPKDTNRQKDLIENLVTESPFLQKECLYEYSKRASSSSPESPDSDSPLLKKKSSDSSDFVRADDSVKSTVSESPLLKEKRAEPQKNGKKVEVESYGGRSAVRTLYARTGYATVTGIPAKWIVEAAEHDQQYPYPHPLQAGAPEFKQLIHSRNKKPSAKKGVLKKVFHRMHGKNKPPKKPLR